MSQLVWSFLILGISSIIVTGYRRDVISKPTSLDSFGHKPTSLDSRRINK